MSSGASSALERQQTGQRSGNRRNRTECAWGVFLDPHVSSLPNRRPPKLPTSAVIPTCEYLGGNLADDLVEGSVESVDNFEGHPGVHSRPQFHPSFLHSSNKA